MSVYTKLYISPFIASRHLLPSDDEDLPLFAGSFLDRRDRSRCSSETDPLQPYPPWYRSFSCSPLTFSRSRSRSCSPFERHPRAEPRCTSRYDLDLHRPFYSGSHSCSPSQDSAPPHLMAVRLQPQPGPMALSAPPPP